MKASLASLAAILLAFPAASAQPPVLPPAVVNPASTAAPKIIVASEIAARAGTTISSAPTFEGVSCGDGCFIAKSAAGGKPAVLLNLSSSEQHAAEFRTGLIVSHAAEHSVDLSLKGADIFGLLCDGHGALKVTPHFIALGASNGGFSWAIFDGDKLIKSGHSTGEAVSYGNGGGNAGMNAPMEIALSNHGVFEVVHEGQRLVFTSDDKNSIGAKTKGTLSFDNLGLRVGGAPAFALVKPAMKAGVQPPGV